MQQDLIPQLATISGILQKVSKQGINTKDSPYEILTSIGTIAAVVVALFAIFLPLIISWLRRPRLQFEFENKEPFCRHTFGLIDLGSGQQVRLNSYYVRLRVKNFGRSITRRCEGKLIAIAHKDLKSLRQDFDPVILHWVGSDIILRNLSANSRSIQHSKTSTVDINSKEYEYLDLISSNERTGRFEIQAIDYDIPRGIVMDPQRDDYFILITLYAENAKPISEIYRITCGSSYDDYKLKVATKQEKQKFYALL